MRGDAGNEAEATVGDDDCGVSSSVDVSNYAGDSYSGRRAETAERST